MAIPAKSATSQPRSLLFKGLRVTLVHGKLEIVPAGPRLIDSDRCRRVPR